VYEVPVTPYFMSEGNPLSSGFVSSKSCDGKKCVLLVVDWSYGFFDDFIVFNKFLLNFHRDL
jgi:hypothetical protein